MDRLTAIVHARLLRAGASAPEAPYLAREAVVAARALGFSAVTEVVRLAVATLTIGEVLAASPADRETFLIALGQREVPAAARLDFVERIWGITREGARR